MGDAPATPAPAAPAPATTTSGADMFEGNAWLTAGAVMMYSTWAMWVKLRNLKFASKTDNESIEHESIENESIENVSVDNESIELRLEGQALKDDEQCFVAENARSLGR
ncbi:uncharacterized protein Dvir_GJ26008 [Drosophila virilis]|uniref:Uncharacterized protein n=1 Tax=Drosophila virilis TaxID=7244 RepID=A0A0Q9W3Y0_DROVI|nr:uncharacterized protein LOC26530778 [Drosophila virilis]KRF79570.1 uncharacterized protein Dvir_GJ26008 [Drosophila virilis]